MSMLIESWAPTAAELLPLLRLAVAVLTVIHILLFKQNSRSAVAWMALVFIFPLFGSIVYWVFGVNRMASADGTVIKLPTTSPVLVKQAKNAEGQLPIDLVGKRVTGNDALAGNRIGLLRDGEQAFPAMLEAIAQAQHEVLLMTYIFEPDETGQLFVEALQAAQQRGVQVCVLLDDVGRRHNLPTVLPSLRRANVDTRCFNPLRLLPPNLGINLRNHRKMLLVDQVVCFAGGMNIGSRHLTDRPSGARTSDICFQYEGPVVAVMRDVYQHDWRRSGGLELKSARVSDDAILGSSTCRVVADGPDHEIDNLTLTILGAVSAAQERITFVTPYFLPNARIVGALQAAALRGVDVKVIIPARCNWPMVRWALNHRIIQMLEVGVSFLEQPPPFAHSKCLLVDQDYALVGSANIDARSLRLNFELGIEIFDAGFCEVIDRYVEERITHATLVDRESVVGRSTIVRLRDAMSNLFDPYL